MNSARDQERRSTEEFSFQRFDIILGVYFYDNHAWPTTISENSTIYLILIFNYSTTEKPQWGVNA
jgi:hypothetical protein